MLQSARSLRKEREKQKEMAQQGLDLKDSTQLLEQRILRLQNQLKDIRKAGMGTTPEGNLKFSLIRQHNCKGTVRFSRLMFSMV